MRCFLRFLFGVTCSTFFLQLADAAPPHLELGQVGSLGGAGRRTQHIVCLSLFSFYLTYGASDFTRQPLHGGPRLVVNIQNDGLRVAGEIAARLDLDLGHGFQAGLLPLLPFGKRPDGDYGEKQS